MKNKSWRITKPKMFMARKPITTEKFIEESVKVHGNKYNYSKTNYVMRTVKLTVICPIHGEFTQWPCSHLAGSGCKECVSDKRRKLLDEFIAESKKKFGNKFDYSLVEYKNAHSVVQLNCSKHGTFNIVARKHLFSPTGCQMCSVDIKRSNTTEFIEKAKDVHGDAYDYAHVEYTAGDKLVKIACNSCGTLFSTRPQIHLRGSGCPNCALTGFNPAQDNSIFYIFRVNGEYVFTKFGITNCLNNRMKTHKRNLQKGNSKIEGDIILIEATGKIIQELERYVKSILYTKVSTLRGFRHESINYSEHEKLIDSAVKWLENNSFTYDLKIKPV